MKNKRLLLDTHIMIWAITDSPKLSQSAKEIIMEETNTIFISTISLWEIEMKRLAKPESIPFTAHEVASSCRASGYRIIPLQENSIYELGSLKRPETASPHKDPFDRMLICQAKSEGLILLTHDALLKDYNCKELYLV